MSMTLYEEREWNDIIDMHQALLKRIEDSKNFQEEIRSSEILSKNVEAIKNFFNHNGMNDKVKIFSDSTMSKENSINALNANLSYLKEEFLKRKKSPELTSVASTAVSSIANHTPPVGGPVVEPVSTAPTSMNPPSEISDVLIDTQDPIVQQAMIQAFNQKFMVAGKYKPGFSEPEKVQIDNKNLIRFKFPDNDSLMQFARQLAAAPGKKFTVYDAKGQVIAHSTGDGNLYHGEDNPKKSKEMIGLQDKFRKIEPPQPKEEPKEENGPRQR